MLLLTRHKHQNPAQVTVLKTFHTNKTYKHTLNCYRI